METTRHTHQNSGQDVKPVLHFAVKLVDCLNIDDSFPVFTFDKRSYCLTCNARLDNYVKLPLPVWAIEVDVMTCSGVVGILVYGG